MELKRGRVPSERIRSDGEFSHLDADRIGWPMERDFLTEMAGGGGVALLTATIIASINVLAASEKR